MRLSSNQRTAGHQRTVDQDRTRTIHVGVVDPARADYACWQDGLAAGQDVQLHFVACGRDALRLANQQRIDLWVVNAELPDLSGVDLCQMLRSRQAQSPVYLVSDTYSADIERQSYAARVSLYGAKPAHHDWLGQWLAHCEQQSLARCG